MSVAILVVICNVLGVLLTAGLAYLDGRLLPKQFPKRFRGLACPFIIDGRFWGTLLFLTPALYIICDYIDHFAAWLAVTIIICAVGSFIYQGKQTGKTTDDALVNYESTTPAGWVHAAQIAIIAAFVISFYLFGAPITADAISVGTLLLAYLIARKIR